MNLTTKRTLGVAAAIALALGTVVATSAQAAPKSVTIAFESPLTGSEAGLGQDELLGAKTALYEYNLTNPAVKVNLLTADDQADSSVSPGVALGLAQNASVIGVVGSCCSGATKAAFPAFKAGRLTVVSPSATNATLTDPKSAVNGFPFFHRVAATDAFQGPALARYAVKGVTSPKVYLIDDASTYGAGLKLLTQPSLKSAGVSVVGSDTVIAPASDYSSTASKVVASKANVVVYFGYYSDAGKLKKALDLAGYKGTFASGDGTDDNGYITSAGKADAEGTLITSQSVPFELAAPAAVQADFTKATGLASAAGHAYVTQAYNATNVFLSCIKNGATTRSAIQNCVATGSFVDVTGAKFSFTRYGDIAQGAPVGAYVVKNGEIVPVGNA
jgi:branched-chain amino acid transport system substrate-binding protein